MDWAIQGFMWFGLEWSKDVRIQKQQSIHAMEGVALAFAENG